MDFEYWKLPNYDANHVGYWPTMSHQKKIWLAGKRSGKWPGLPISMTSIDQLVASEAPEMAILFVGYVPCFFDAAENCWNIPWILNMIQKWVGEHPGHIPMIHFLNSIEVKTDALLFVHTWSHQSILHPDVNEESEFIMQWRQWFQGDAT